MWESVESKSNESEASQVHPGDLGGGGGGGGVGWRGGAVNHPSRDVWSWSPLAKIVWLSKAYMLM